MKLLNTKFQILNKELDIYKNNCLIKTKKHTIITNKISKITKARII